MKLIIVLINIEFYINYSNFIEFQYSYLVNIINILKKNR